MVTGKDCSKPSVLDAGDSANRFVCDSREQTMSSVLLMESRCISTDTGCFVHKLGRHDGICISTHKSVGQGTQTHDEVSVRIDSDSTNVGTSALVSNDSSVVDSSTSQAFRKGMLHPNPKLLKLTAWRLSTNGMKQKDFLDKLENYCVHHGESEPRKIIDVNLGNSLAGVVKDKLIPIVHL
ncbi:hypothetical protein DPMN_141431 [Dreissena polymorpha]|uniref:Uncharacterized protein n=1 Tax=Dreissena polymorpha TaxID=45954 RepID=A0A9D4G9D7_DREPO|nr:hypothetical protein DPMN_141431 [Dreissena polymorpha]